MVDGLSWLGDIVKVLLLLAISGIPTAVAFVLTFSMHELIYALTFISFSVKKKA